MKLLFVAHDMGAAVMLMPVIEKLLSENVDVKLIAAGPALNAWENFESHQVSEEIDKIEEIIISFSPDLIITGTAHYSDMERNTWLAAKKYNVKSLAAIDAWVNFKERFIKTDSNQFVEPDILCVIDSDCESNIKKLGVNSKIYITGHPHLEYRINKLKEKCKSTVVTDKKKICFFSNPVKNNSQTNVSSDKQFTGQFDIACLLINSFPNDNNIELFLKPHPREDIKTWEIWLKESEFMGRNITISNQSTEELLIKCDAIIGITSMVLIEAALLGKATMSLQPYRERCVNPAVDKIPGLYLVLEDKKIEADLNVMLNNLDKSVNYSFELKEQMYNSINRFINIVQKEATTHN